MAIHFRDAAPLPTQGPQVLDQGGGLPVGQLHPHIPLPSLPRDREVPHEREGGLPDVGGHVHEQGAPWGEAALSRLPDSAGRGDGQAVMIQSYLCQHKVKHSKYITYVFLQENHLNQ